MYPYSYQYSLSFKRVFEYPEEYNILLIYRDILKITKYGEMNNLKYIE